MRAHVGGRPSGARDKSLRSSPARKAAAAAAALGITPLEVMLQAMRTHHGAGDWDKAVAIAEKAAPYVHARLAQVDASLRAEGLMTHRFVLMGVPEAASPAEWEAGQAVTGTQPPALPKADER